MNSSEQRPLRLLARVTGFFAAFTASYAAFALLIDILGFWPGPGDLTAVALAAAACLLLWRIPLRDQRRPFSYGTFMPGLLICCSAAATACAVQWNSAEFALVPAVLMAAASAVLEELVFRRAPVELLKRSGRRDMAAKAGAGVVSTCAFVLLHHNTDPWLVADKVVFGLVAFCLTLITASLLLPVLLHLASNLVLEAAVQTRLVEEGGTLLALDCLLMGAVVAALLVKIRKPDHLSRMTKTR